MLDLPGFKCKLTTRTSKLMHQRDFKDAELYLIRYQQCMTRSMTLIKLYVVSAIRAMGQEVTKRMVDKVGDKPVSFSDSPVTF
jgi:hypothetical protein